MNLYRATVQHGPDSHSEFWASTDATAKREAKAHIKEFGCAFAGSLKVEVPTDKKGLIEFLNARG